MEYSASVEWQLMAHPAAFGASLLKAERQLTGQERT
jgi:hypothetical protein